MWVLTVVLAGAVFLIERKECPMMFHTVFAPCPHMLHVLRGRAYASTPPLPTLGGDSSLRRNRFSLLSTPHPLCNCQPLHANRFSNHTLPLWQPTQPPPPPQAHPERWGFRTSKSMSHVPCVLRLPHCHREEQIRSCGTPQTVSIAGLYVYARIRRVYVYLHTFLRIHAHVYG